MTDLPIKVIIIQHNQEEKKSLDDILTHPGNKTFYYSIKGIEIYSPDGRGAFFHLDGSFRGFIKMR